MKLKKITKEYLPTNLINSSSKLLDDYRDSRSKNNLILAVGLIFNKSLSNNQLFVNSFIPLSSSYWKKIIGSHYPIYLKKLVDNNIIESKWVSYLYDNGTISHVKGYRINPDFLNDDFDVIEYFGKTLKNSSNESDELSELNLKGLSPKSYYEFKPQQIKMLKPEALEWINNNASKLVEKYINSDFINGLPSAMPIKVKTLDDNCTFYEQYLSVDSANRVAQEQGKQLFYYKDSFVISEKQQFIDLTTKSLLYSYKWHIKSFHPNSFNLKRNNKTLRVYSQLTSLPTALLPFIRIDNNYAMQADLKCSQFTLFANILNLFITNKNGDELVNLFTKKQTKEFIKKLVTTFQKYQDLMPENGLNFNNPIKNDYDLTNNDIYKFLVDALLNDFYGVLKNELKLPQRAHAKTIAFRTIFSNPKNTNQFINQFSDIYPSVIKMVNDFKNEHVYNQFAIGLQNVEAEIFIDNIWAKTIDSKINSFTRHDSLVFPLTKKSEVESIIKNVFDEFKFIYKVEYDAFNEDEIWQRLIDDTNFLDSMEDEFDELFFYTMTNPNNDNIKDESVEGINDIDIECIEDVEVEDIDEDEENEITEENYWDYVYEMLEEAEIELPDELRDDYYGYASIDLLTVLVKLEGIDYKTKKALEEDILNLTNELHVQNPSFQPETNEFITRLIKKIG